MPVDVEELYPNDPVAQYVHGPLTYFKVIEKSFFSLASIYWNSTKLEDDDKLDELDDKYEKFSHKEVNRAFIRRLPTLDLIYLTEKMHASYWFIPTLVGINIGYILATYKLFKRHGKKVPIYFKIKEKSFKNIFKYGKLTRHHSRHSLDAPLRCG